MVEDAAESDWLSRRRRYRRMAFGVLAAGAIGYVIAVAINYPIIGVGIYWLGFVGFFAVKWWVPITLFDERDCALERQASYDALRLVGVALIVLGPTAGTLAEIGYYELPPVAVGALFGGVALYAVFGISYLVRRYRP